MNASINADEAEQNLDLYRVAECSNHPTLQIGDIVEVMHINARGKIYKLRRRRDATMHEAKGPSGEVVMITKRRSTWRPFWLGTATSYMKIRLWQIGDRGDVIDFSTCPPDRDGRTIHITRSIIEEISRDAALPNGWRPCEVKLPDWLIEKEGL